MPSPVPDRPGLLIRDSLQYSDTTLIIPPLLAQCLQCFDGQATEADLREALFRITGDLRVGELERHLVQSLSDAGFLEDPVYERLRGEKHRAFAESPVRIPSHAGASYPGEAEELSALLREYVDHGAPRSEEGDLIGIAAPHISLEGGRDCYRAAYGALPPEYKDKTFVVLGTSHYGQPEKFGLTRKPFKTPLGVTGNDVDLVEELNREAPGAVVMEDYIHAVEHSIEFQVIFLQHLFGPSVRIVPVLCGSYARSLYEGGSPDDDPGVARFLDVLGGVAAREGKRLFWVLGIDMAHQGPRYGDEAAMQAHQGEMAAVAERERRRIDFVEAGDVRGFWESVQQSHDDLRWCGASALYTFLKALPGVKGRLLRYDQWNIDEQSVVSFGAIAFHR